MELVTDLTLVLVAALAGGFLAHRLRQPLIVGYILAGVAVGHGGLLKVANVHDIEQLAEVGVILLLFSLGIELSIRELLPVRAIALAGTTLQIGLTLAFGYGLGRVMGWEWRVAVWFGAMISLSSTMVALKTIHAQGRLGTLSSHVMLGMLVVQDLAVVPLMIVLPELSDPAGHLGGVVLATLRAGVTVAAIVFVATRIVPHVLAVVARWQSRELFLLSTTAVALGVAYATWLLGLSLAVGAFVAGLVISESEYAHQALSDVVPLRDVFGMVFFVSVGLLLDPAQMWAQVGTLSLVVAAVVVGKGAVLSAVVRLFGYVNVIPLAVGLTLFQVGEFAFVLARTGLESKAIPPDVYAITLNTAVLTMALTPLLSGVVTPLYTRFRARRPRERFETINIPRAGLSDHIVIAGAGRVGRSIADALSHLGLPCALIESNDRRVQQARAAGLPVVYGDASGAAVLEAASLARARALLVTVPSFADVRGIVHAARQLRGDVPIIARADGFEAIVALYGLGIQEVASPEVEAGIEMTRQALEYLDVPAHDVLRVASVIRRERYGMRGADLDARRALIPQLGEITRQLDFSWLRLPEESPLAGRSLGDLQLRSRTGVVVVGIVRGGTLVPNPDAHEHLGAGDLVAVLGTRAQIERFEEAARAGVGAC
jgi:CPA2 family monovalent cation:H+ antiporter-2